MSRSLPIGEQFELAYHPGNLVSTALEAQRASGSPAQRLVSRAQPPPAFHNSFPAAYYRPAYAARKRAAAQLASAAHPHIASFYPASAKPPVSTALRPPQAHSLRLHPPARPSQHPGPGQTGAVSFAPAQLSALQQRERRRRALGLAFGYLDRGTLARRVAPVCREWAELVETREGLWDAMELGGKELSEAELRAVARRQPRRLNLSWSSLNEERARLALWGNERLAVLSLAGCSSSAVAALAVLGPSLGLEELDLRWVEGLDDAAFAALLHAWPGLALCQSLSLSASRVADPTAALIAARFRRLRRLDLSHTALSDAGLAALAECASLVELNLASCANLTPAIFPHLLRLPGLGCLDLRAAAIPPQASAEFKDSARALGRCLSLLTS